ncbi:MAG TPA: hypothetical protein VM891_12350, partial [Amaricoccus sp.]|nr:hypothetical protein [Amaricoccus sp.]
MSKEGQLVRLGDGRAEPIDEAGLAALLDPVALEERLREARARRTAALARRDAPGEAAPPAPPVLRADAASPAPRPRRLPSLVPALIFTAGLALGGDAVLGKRRRPGAPAAPGEPPRQEHRAERAPRCA